MPKFGKWAEVQPKLKLVAAMIKPTSVKYLDGKAKEFIERIREHVENQDLPLPALAPSTVARKKQHQTDWWIESGRFLKGLSTRKAYTGKRTASVVAGAFPDKKYNDKFSMYDIAMRLERGYGRIQARPLFMLTMLEFKNECKDFNKVVGSEIMAVWE